VRRPPDIAPDLRHDRIDVAPPQHVATATRVHAAQMRQHGSSDLVDQCIDIDPAHQFALLVHQAQLQHLGVDLDVISVGLCARRLLPLAPQVSRVGNAALIEREAGT
jgi:hypothetical protein